MKKLLCILLVVSLCLGMTPVEVIAEDKSLIEGATTSTEETTTSTEGTAAYTEGTTTSTEETTETTEETTTSTEETTEYTEGSTTSTEETTETTEEATTSTEETTETTEETTTSTEETTETTEETTESTEETTEATEEILYNVSFQGGEGAEGTDPAPEEYLPGDTLLLPENPYENGDLIFLGWSDGESVFAAGAEYTMPEADVTFTAQWRQLLPTEMKVTYDFAPAQADNDWTAAAELYNKSSLNLLDPALKHNFTKGHEQLPTAFVVTSRTPEAFTLTVRVNDEVFYTYTGRTEKMAEDYAQTVWDLPLVAFHLNGHGQPIIGMAAVTGEKISRPEDPAEQGMFFYGWYRDPACTEETLWDFENDLVSGDMNLYAGWDTMPVISLMSALPGTVIRPETSILNSGYPYGKDMGDSQITLVLDTEVTAAEGAGEPSYQWQVSAEENGTYEDILDANTAEYRFAPSSGSWYRCVVNAGDEKEVTSRAVQVVYPGQDGRTWTKSNYSYYITNGTVAYMVNGYQFDVTGLYESNYMLSTSYNRYWTTYGSGGSGFAPRKLCVSFSDRNNSAVVFEAYMNADQESFAIGADTQLGNSSTSGSYSDRAALVGTVNNNKLEHVAMIGAASKETAQETDPAFVISPITPSSSFWIGIYYDRIPFAYNTTSGYGYTSEPVNGQNVVTCVEGKDSGMTISWTGMPAGGSLQFQFAVGNVEETGAFGSQSTEAPSSGPLQGAAGSGIDSVVQAEIDKLFPTDDGLRHQVDVTLKIEDLNAAQEESETLKGNKQKITSIANGQILNFFDLSLNRIVDQGDPSKIADTGANPVKMEIPFDIAGKQDPKVYRVSSTGAAEVIPSTVVNGKITFDTTKFTSDGATYTYAIGYDPIFTVTFQVNGGSGSMENQNVILNRNTALKANTFEKQGYVFAAWNTQSNGSGTAYADQADVTDLLSAGETLALYAQWTPATDTAYQVKHMRQAADGSYPDSLMELEDKTGTTGETTAAAAKTYAGFTAPQEILQGTVGPDGSTVVEIRYTRNTYQITFDCSDVNAIEALYEAEVTKPAQDPQKPGYGFVDWYENADFTGEAYIFDKMPLNGIQLYAKWELTEPQAPGILKNPESAEAVYPNTVTLTADYEEVADPSISYTYDWYSDDQKVGTGKTLTLDETADSGSYLVKVTVADGQESKTSPASQAAAVQISPAQITGELSQTNVLTYNGQSQVAAAAGLTAEKDQSISVLYGIAADQCSSEEIPGFEDAGEYTVYYVASAPNHSNKTGSFTVTIDEKDISGAEVELDNSLTYNGRLQTQEIKAFQVDGLDVTYTLSNHKETDAASNYVLTVTGSGNFKGTVQKEFSIARKELTVAVTVKDKQYDGLKNAEILEASLVGAAQDDDVLLVNGIPLFRNASAGKQIVDFTPFSLEGSRKDNYTLTQPTGIEANILNDWTLTKNVEYTLSGEGWLNQPLEIKALDGYVLSLTDSFAGTWTSQLTAAQVGAESTVSFYAKNLNTGAISLQKTEIYQLDQTAPTGTVTISRSSWEEFLNQITFGQLYKEKQQLQVTAQDELSGIKKIEYYESPVALTLEQVQKLTAWIFYEGSPVVNAEHEKQFVCYVKLTDNAGNVTYLSSDGAEFDTQAPQFTGASAAGSPYYTTQLVKVSDSHLSALVLNGKEMTLEEGKTQVSILLAGDVKKDTVYTIAAADRAGNVSSLKITMKPLKEFFKSVEEIGEESVKSSHKSAVEEIRNQINRLLTESEHLTENEKKILTQEKQREESLLKKIQATEETLKKQKETLDSYELLKVNSGDKRDLNTLLGQMDDLLAGDNLTPEQRAQIHEEKKQAQALLKQIQKAEDALKTGSILAAQGITKDTVRFEDEKKLHSAKESLQAVLLGPVGGNFTDAEKIGIQNEIARIEGALAALNHVRAFENQAQTLPEKAKPDDLAAREKILAAKTLLDSLTEHEKNLSKEEYLKKLQDLLAQIVDYKITKGNAQHWTRGEDQDIHFTANGAKELFTGLYIDGSQVAPRYYETESGSTVLTIQERYMKKLKGGKHSILMKYVDGAAEGTFRVEVPSQAPGTGDSFKLLLWSGLLAASAGGLILYGFLRKKKKNKLHT